MSIKKIFAALLAAVTLLFVSGCGGTSPDDYVQSLRTEFETVQRAMENIQKDVKKNKFNDYDITIAERGFSNIEALEPPKGYEELHEQLCKGIDKEREMLALIKDIYDIWKKKDPKDNQTLKNMQKQLEDLASDNTFTDAIIGIAEKYKNG